MSILNFYFHIITMTDYFYFCSEWWISWRTSTILLPGFNIIYVFGREPYLIPFIFNFGFIFRLFERNWVSDQKKSFQNPQGVNYHSYFLLMYDAIMFPSLLLTFYALNLCFCRTNFPNYSVLVLVLRHCSSNEVIVLSNVLSNDVSILSY